MKSEPEDEFEREVLSYVYILCDYQADYYISFKEIYIESIRLHNPVPPTSKNDLVSAVHRLKEKGMLDLNKINTEVALTDLAVEYFKQYEKPKPTSWFESIKRFFRWELQ